jgi:acetylornithine deacetylase/succinyl-diaminopimelate desuccinylase-like protein
LDTKHAGEDSVLDRTLNDKVCATIEGMREDLTQLALDLGNIESPPGHERAAGDYVYDWMARFGFNPERIGVFDDRFNVIGRVKGSGGGLSLSFNSHLDTSMAREDSFRFINASDRVYHEAWYEDGRIYGYPVVNCKGPMTCWMVAAKALKDAGVTLKGDLVLAAVCGEMCEDPADEFQGHDYLGNDIGTRYAITHGALSHYALVAEATNFTTAWVEAGKLFIKITVLAGPSRYTPYMPRPLPALKSPNAIVRMAKLVDSLEEWADDYEKRYTRSYSGGTVVPKAVIGCIRGGVPYKISRAPELCSVYLDVRLNPDTSPLTIQDEIAAVVHKIGLTAEVKPFLYRRGFNAEGIEPLRGAVESAHQAIIGHPAEMAESSVSSMWRDTNPYNEMGIPSLTYGCGGGSGSGTISFAVDDMIKAAKIYAITAMELCNRNVG